MATMPKDVETAWPLPPVTRLPVRSAAPDPASAPLSAVSGEDTLARIAADFGAQAVALARLEHPGKFRVTTSIGLPLLPVNVSLPLDTATLAHDAAHGPLDAHASVSFSRADRPLDSIAANVGLRSGIGLAVVEGSALTGILAIGWTAEEPPTDVIDVALPEHQRRELHAMLASATSPAVVVCHEEWLLAAGLARTLERSIGATAEIASTVASATALMAGHAPDLVVCSDRLAVDAGLTEATRQLRLASDDAPILVVTRCCDAESLDLALRAGAKGYLSLDVADQHLSEYSSKLLQGETALPPTPPRRVEAHLTGREQEVLRCFERGMYDKQIAGELGVALSTVKTHARGIYAKLGVGTRTAAIYRARAHGLI